MVSVKHWLFYSGLNVSILLSWLKTIILKYAWHNNIITRHENRNIQLYKWEQEVIKFYCVISRFLLKVIKYLQQYSYSKIHNGPKWANIHPMLGTLAQCQPSCSLLILLVLKLEYSRITRSIQSLLMPWILASPGHQRPWYWLCRLDGSLSPRAWRY